MAIFKVLFRGIGEAGMHGLLLNRLPEHCCLVGGKWNVTTPDLGLSFGGSGRSWGTGYWIRHSASSLPSPPFCCSPARPTFVMRLCHDPSESSRVLLFRVVGRGVAPQGGKQLLPHRVADTKQSTRQLPVVVDDFLAISGDREMWQPGSGAAKSF